MASIWDAIAAVTNDPHERAILAYDCAAESGCQPVAQTGGGPGMGFYQIEPGQGVSQACAYDPVCSTQAFYAHWGVAQAAKRVDWSNIPNALLQAAGLTEKPGVPYNAAQQQAGLQAAQPYLGDGTGVHPIVDPNQGGWWNAGQGWTNAQAGASDALGQVNPFAPLIALLMSPDLWIRVTLVAGGLVLVLVGVGKIGADTVSAHPEIAAAAL